MSTSLENNITAALTGRKNTETLRSTSLENNIAGAITRRKSSWKPTVEEDDDLVSSQTSTLKKYLPNSLA